jgi:hypothetical protein
MGLRRFTLYHRIFAHDASPGGSGGGILPIAEQDARAVVPESVLHSIDQLLESITPEGDATAYAVQRALIPEAVGSFACLIVCHPFHRDGIERPASVTHARILRVDSAEAWLDVDALIRLADGFSIDALRGPLGGDFARYLRENEAAVDVAGWNPARFEDVPRPFARQVVGACLSRWSRNEAMFHIDPRDSIELLSDIAAAWSVLPLYAQLVSPFSLHAQRGARVKALFSTLAQANDSEVSDGLKRWAAEYVDWVHDRPDDVRLLTEDREIRDLKTLEERFRALTAEARNVASAPRKAGEGAMSKRKPDAPARTIRRGGLDQEAVAVINREVRSAEESLRAYVDRRVGAAGAGKRISGAGAGGDAASGYSFRGRMHRWPPWVQPVAAAVIALGLIAALVYVVMQGRARDARLDALEKRLASVETMPAPAAASHGQAAAAPPVTEAVHHSPTPATELPGDGWALRFQGLSEHDPQRLGSIVNAIVKGDEEIAMPTETLKPFTRIRDLLAAGTRLERTDRALLRTLLVQCIADQAAKPNAPNVVFDGRFDGIPKVLLNKVKGQLHVVSKPGSKEQADFESEVILRWAQEKRL